MYEVLALFLVLHGRAARKAREESGDVSYPGGVNKKKLTSSDTGLRLDVRSDARAAGL